MSIRDIFPSLRNKEILTTHFSRGRSDQDVVGAVADVRFDGVLLLSLSSLVLTAC